MALLVGSWSGGPEEHKGGEGSGGGGENGAFGRLVEWRPGSLAVGAGPSLEGSMDSLESETEGRRKGKRERERGCVDYIYT